VSGWRDALDCQLATLDWLRIHDKPLPVDSPELDYGLEWFGEEDLQKKIAQADHLLNGLGRRTLAEAEPVFISAPIVDLIEASHESFQPEVVHPWDAFVPIGFAVFARPLKGVAALSWVPISHAEDEDPAFFFASAWGGDGPRVKLLGSAAMVIGESDVDWGRDDVPGAAPVVERLTQVTWRLAKQVVRMPERSPRAVRRAAQRKGIERDGVLVVRLRRPAPPVNGDEPSPVGWQHQWVVRGHWRNQWFPAHETHRQIWISPYVKGPEDKPLKPVTGRAWEFVR
jgi:hypothetical protein